MSNQFRLEQELTIDLRKEAEQELRRTTNIIKAL